MNNNQHPNHQPRNSSSPSNSEDGHQLYPQNHSSVHPAKHQSKEGNNSKKKLDMSLPWSPDDNPEDPPSKKRQKEQFRNIFSLVKLVGGALLIAILIIQFVFQPYEVFGHSMTPTLDEGDRLIISKVGKTWSLISQDKFIPDRGEIIVFKSPIRQSDNLIKRVIGLPGDTVEVDDGIITITNEENPNGFNPDSEYEETLTDVRSGNITVRVGPGQVFVSGDNRAPDGSLDSRNALGLVPSENIIGVLVMRIMPLSEASFY